MINLILYFVEVISVITALVFFLNINNKKIQLTLLNIILIFVISFLLFVINNNDFFKWLLSFFLICILYLIYIDQNKKKAIINSLFFCLIVFLVDILIAIFGSFFLGKYKMTILLTKYYKIIFTLIENLIFILLSKIPLTKKIIKNVIEKILNESQDFYYLLIYGIIYISTSALLYNVILKELPLLYFLLLLFSCTLILIYSQIEIYKLKEIDKQKNSLLKLNKFYGNLLEEDKIYKHNIKNKFLTIKNIGNEKTKKLIDEYLNEDPKSTRETNNLYNIPNSIKGIICEKLYQFKWTKIVVNNQLKKDPFKYKYLNTYSKLCSIIGISLDNAIEATENIKDSYIYLNFKDLKGFYMIEIINNYIDNIDIEKLGTRNYSTKNRGSGFGLYSVLKYKEITTKYKIINNNFITIIKIKKPKVR